ncbi:ribonuclease HII [Sandaracinus amylolyticus]|uniref:Ribonuclease HII n=1 Tax=Sandaracinus amylolyticus TaxID=927083 RepID=A0A0F6W1N8_9BACT|nr:ribonuclease HII [Sandaracinus amylolyticus]AKF05161.1 Ribonuclease HII [Sandaracinus amylolyticus]
MSEPKKLTLSELRKRYVDEARPLPQEIETALRADERPGAKSLLAAIEKRRRANRAEGQRLRHLSRFENELWESGVQRVAGVDEAGMSPLAGPVVAGAVILPVGFKLVGVDDSKKLDAKARAELVIEIKARAIAWAVGIVPPDEIDRVNIYRAGLLAMRRAVEALHVAPEHLLIDARKLKELAIPQRAIIHGDALSVSIAAASIVAKTTRDGMMDELDRTYPGYGFAKHKGYPVAEHTDAITKLGVCAIHRRSFGPVRRALGLEPVQTELFATPSETPAIDPTVAAEIAAMEAEVASEPQ